MQTDPLLGPAISRLEGAIRKRAAQREQDRRKVSEILASVIRVPTIILWGTRDPALAPSLLDDMSRRICPGAEVRRLEGASHWVPDERPDDLARAVRRVEDGDARAGG